MLTKVVRALVGLGIVLAGPATTHAATIELQFFDGEFGNGLTADFSEFGDDYKFVLTFDELADDAGFIVEVTDIQTTQVALEDGERFAGFPGHVCVPIADGVNTCVEFEVNAPDPGPTTWLGEYEIQIIWAANTDPSFPNDPGNRIRMLHNRGDTLGNTFNTDITVFDSYFADPDLDPWIFGRDNNFQSFIVTQAAPVPEPATLALLGTGLAALAYRRRHRKPHPKHQDPI